MTEKEMKNFLTNLNDIKSQEGVLQSVHSRLEIYDLVLQHEMKLFSNLNTLTFKGGNIFYGFAWSKMKTPELYQ